MIVFIRLILSVFLLYFVYEETGIATTICLSLIFIAIELYACFRK